MNLKCKNNQKLYNMATFININLASLGNSLCKLPVRTIFIASVNLILVLKHNTIPQN